MENKIAEITGRILKEGVEKGEAEAGKLVEEAKARAEKIISDARREAEKMKTEAEKKAEDLKRTVASEIKLSGQQALSAIKQQILDVITANTIEAGVSKTLDDPTVLKETILAVINAWKPGSTEEISLDLVLPESRKEELQKSLTASIQKELKKGVNISFSRGLKGGFQIGPSDGSFRIGMSDEEFSEFFKEFARPRAREYLFGDK